MASVVTLHGEILRWRERKGLSLEQVAAACSVSIERVKAWESGGRTPHLGERNSLKALGFRPVTGWNFVKPKGDARPGKRWDREEPRRTRFFTPFSE